jgi:hypothetical protein
VLFWMEHVGLVQLNLGTKKALVLWRGSDNAARTVQALLYEINLISVLECMKSFWICLFLFSWYVTESFFILLVVN